MAENAAGPCVLVVEDDEEVSSLLAQVLGEARFKVEVRGTLQLARGSVKKELPDMVVLDRQLPDGDGIDFCRELRMNPATRGIPILFLTSKKSASEKVLGLDQGADDYLAKPFNASELLARVKAILRRTMAVPEQPAVLTAGPTR